MGTNISANLFASAPAVATKGVNSVRSATVEGRSTAASQQGKNFSSELKNASTEDKIAAAVEQEAQTTAEVIPAKAAQVDETGKETGKDTGSAEGKTDLAAEEKLVADVDEVTEAAENLAAQVAANAAQMPMAELTTYFQSSGQEDAPSVSIPIEQAPENALQAPENVRQTSEMEEAPVQQAAVPEISTVAQEVQQPMAAANLTQQMPTEEVKVDTEAKGMAVVHDNAVADEAELQPQSQSVQPSETKAEMPQPKSIEALLKPVEPVEKVQQVTESTQGQETATMSNEQQMLAVLSGRQFINRTSPTDSSQPIQPQQEVQTEAETTASVLQEAEVQPQIQAHTAEPVAVRTADAAPKSETPASNKTLDAMNNLLGQEVKVVAGTAEKQTFNSDSQPNQQQSFQQEPMVETPAFTVSQVTEDEPAAVFHDAEPTQAVNTISSQPAVNEAANVDNPQPVSQARTDYNITQQIVEQARLIRNAETTEMVIKLNPRHLGDLTLKVAVNSNGGVTATFHTDNAQVRALLETSMIQLQKELNDQGIKVDSVEVQTGLTDGQLPEGQSQGYYQQQAQQSARSQKLDLKDFEEDVDQLSAEPVNNATDVIRDSEGNKISDGVDYAV